jgi:V8-like Glu-specific endopeptidase
VLLKIRLSVVWAAAIMLLTVLACSAIALAITNGTPDGKKESDGSYTYPTDGSYTYKYPQVGALLDPKGFGDGTYTYCTGTLISPTVFLTAAHCDPLTGDELTFDAKYVAGSSQVYSICKGSTCTGDQPGDKYDGKFRADPSGNDIAVVVFGDPISGITPARLSSLHRFDTVAKDQGFTAVGYGGYKADNQAGGSSSIVYDDVRRYGVSTFKSVNQTYLRLSQNQGSGGTCYGDSGGPNFFGAGTAETNVIAGITITGDTWCNSTNVTLRLDTEAARAFLSRPFLKDEGITLPPAKPPVP